MNARLTTWLLGSLLAFVAPGCSLCKEPVEPEPAPRAAVVRVRYAQTYCADRWGQAGSQQLVAVATAYLSQQGITFTDAHTTLAGAATCAACTCKTGTVLEGQVSASQLAAIEALGFWRM